MQWSEVSVLENAIKPRMLLQSGSSVEEGRRDEVGVGDEFGITLKFEFIPVC